MDKYYRALEEFQLQELSEIEEVYEVIYIDWRKFPKEIFHNGGGGYLRNILTVDDKGILKEISVVPLQRITEEEYESEMEEIYPPARIELEDNVIVLYSGDD